MSKFSITEAELRSCMFGTESLGICLACGEQTDGVEPDAEGYECEICGRRTVMGVPQALLAGELDIE